MQLIPAEWVEVSTAMDTSGDPAANYQYFWWVKADLTDRHHYTAAGKHGQYIYIIPEQNLVLVRFGRTDPLQGNWGEVFETLAAQIERAGQ